MTAATFSEDDIRQIEALLRRWTFFHTYPWKDDSLHAICLELCRRGKIAEVRHTEEHSAWRFVENPDDPERASDDYAMLFGKPDGQFPQGIIEVKRKLGAIT